MNNELPQMPHAMTLKDRKHLAVTGVSEVASFDENAVVLHTGLGTLVVQGRDLKLRTLTLEGGQVVVDGTVSALVYEEARPQGGWWRRLLK